MVAKFSSNNIEEQFPSLLPSQVSFLFLTHSEESKLESSLVVQHLDLSQIFSLMSSSLPRLPVNQSEISNELCQPMRIKYLPIWTSTDLKIMFEAADTERTVHDRARMRYFMLTNQRSVLLCVSQSEISINWLLQHYWPEPLQWPAFILLVWLNTGGVSGELESSQWTHVCSV